MNSSTVPSRLGKLRLLLWGLVAVAAIGLGVALALRPGASPPASTSDVRGVPQGGGFTLTDQDGRRVSDASFAGRYRLIYFGYTFCPDVCPVDVQTIGQALRILEKRAPAKAARLQPIFITADPKRDNPKVLKEFVGNFHPRLIGLTGSEAEIKAALKTFGIKGVGSIGEPQPPGPGGGYLVNHTRFKMLYGPDGQGIAFMPDDGGAEALADALERNIR